MGQQALGRSAARCPVEAHRQLWWPNTVRDPDPSPGATVRYSSSITVQVRGPTEGRTAKLFATLLFHLVEEHPHNDATTRTIHIRHARCRQRRDELKTRW
jgi:hypothetical protein